LSVPQNHFWAGSSCLLKGDGHAYPGNVTAISDILTIKADLVKQMPNKSYMIYMLELFMDSKRGVPIELDLFCEPGDKVNFIPVFYGTNQPPSSPYSTFESVPPEIGHSYLREIVTNASERSILYRVRDLKNGKSGSFKLEANDLDGAVNDPKKKEVIKEVKFQPYKHFTGIEWWNRSGENVPFPVRYRVQFSMLRYAPSLDSPPNSEKLGYKPYTRLSVDKDTLGKQYPIIFDNLREMDGCICYDVNSGSTSTGITFSL
jgi:hypothetical protein